jgi:hypothetical protein
MELLTMRITAFNIYHLHQQHLNKSAIVSRLGKEYMKKELHF